MVTYLDNSASTPMRPEAADALRPYLGEHYGNPSGGHALARRARRAVDDARDMVAAAIGAEPGDVVFTGGGTEADNLAVFGAHGRRAGTVVCSAIEHHAVLEPVGRLGGRVIPATAGGVIDLDALQSCLDDTVVLVSVMAANNETGVTQPLDSVAQLVRRRAPNALFHTDAVQAFSWCDVAELCGTADLISISAHKFGGPQGVGALIQRDGAELEAQLIGGGQERERRSGTQNVAGIVAMGAAAAATAAQRPETVARVAKLRDRLADGLLASIPDARETGGPPPDRGDRVAGVCHLCFRGVESEALVMVLEDDEVYGAAGASCASGAVEASHVLRAMGVTDDWAKGALRLSLGYQTTGADVDAALAAVPAAVARLREAA